MSNEATPSEAAPDANASHGHNDGLTKLALAALGVVYGDIGTSPLYAVKECFAPGHGVEPTPGNVLGILSLIVWSLVLVIVVKYISFIMRADNRGEGGILALLALVTQRFDPGAKGSRATLSERAVVIALGLFGAALLYGDGVITPAISVLSAVEGLEVATSAFTKWVVPITLVILVGLFLVQRRGTGRIGSIFGPAMVVWFVAIGLLGIVSIAHYPAIIGAINPLHGVRFLVLHGMKAFLVLGSVVLAITGGEALYADMGHFGRVPIRVAWYAVAMPGLVLNYLGQGVVLLEGGAEAAKNPFYALAAGWTLYPMVVISTVATVIASQALISGAFSLTQQAVQLGYWPRVQIVHTSEEAAGQIYIPEINYGLMAACLALVLGFRSSSGLAAAYGIAVTGTMGITSVFFYAVARQRLGWSKLAAGSLVGLFLSIDLAFFLANVTKIEHGGWFPIVVALLMFTVMTTWRRGRAELSRMLVGATLELDLFMMDLDSLQPPRVAGTAVFMTPAQAGVPPVLLHHLKHNKMLHEQIVLLSIVTDDVPVVPPLQRVSVEKLEHGFWRVIAHYGFMQHPNTLLTLKRCGRFGLTVDPASTSFFLGRETLIMRGRTTMSRWRKVLFVFLSRNSRDAASFFGLPPNRVVELGMQIEI